MNNQGQDADTIDNYRAIMYFGYSFSDKIKFQSEIEQTNREFYFVILKECGNLMLDDELGNACKVTGYDKVKELINTLRAEKLNDLDKEMYKCSLDILKDNERALNVLRNNKSSMNVEVKSNE